MSPTFTNILHGDFPNYSFGVTLDMPLRNRTAQADAERALLEQRRLQVKLQNAKNQAVWDVNKAWSGVRQARDQPTVPPRPTPNGRCWNNGGCK